TYAGARRTADAHRLLDELDDRASRGEYVTPVACLTIHMGLRDPASTAADLEACVKDGSPVLLIKAMCGPQLERYRKDWRIDPLLNAVYGRQRGGDGT